MGPEGVAGEGPHGEGTVLQAEPVSLGQGVTGEWLRESEVSFGGGSASGRAGQKPKNPTQIELRERVPRHRLQVWLDPGPLLVLPPHLWAPRGTSLMCSCGSKSAACSPCTSSQHSVISLSSPQVTGIPHGWVKYHRYHQACLSQCTVLGP